MIIVKNIFKKKGTEYMYVWFCFKWGIWKEFQTTNVAMRMIYSS